MSNTFPVEEIKTEFLQALDDQPLILLTAPPGAGKSTVLPLWLLDAKGLQGQKIYLLQPRRVAAKNIATYLASQLGERVGQRVGYRLRNETCVSENTVLEVITEGILTRIMQADPEMEDCSLILFDEFHERSTQADLAFAIARDIQQGLRDDLTLVLMSATLATEAIQNALPDAYLLQSEGRTYPIEYEYRPPKTIREWRQHTLFVLKEQINQISSSILVFLPGASDIHWLFEQLENSSPSHIDILPLFGDLSLKDQQEVIAPASAGKFKVVLATNIAETSLTIEGINLVIDSGYEKVAVFDQGSLTNHLNQQTISRASAVQRAGRAGRLMAGKCIRLYSQEDFNRRPEQADFSITRADILPLLIESARWGVSKLFELPMLTYPNIHSEQAGWALLQQLSITDNRNKLTQHGEQVAKLATHPRFAHMLIVSMTLEESYPNITSLGCLLAAMLEERDVFAHQQLAATDIELRVNFIVNQQRDGRCQRILKQAKQLAKQLKVVFNKNFSVSMSGLLLALAYPERLAKVRGQHGQYLAANGKGLSLDSADSLAQHQYLAVAVTSGKQGKQQIRQAAFVDIEALLIHKLVSVTEENVLDFDETTGRIQAYSKQAIGALSYQEKPTQAKLSPDLLGKMWCDQINKNGLSWLKFDDAVQQLIAKLNWLNTYQPEVTLPDYSEQALLADMTDWLVPYVGDVKNKQTLLKLDFNGMLLSRIDYNLQQLIKEIAPDYFIGPTGRRCPITYSEDRSPKVSLPMQEVYGLASSPNVGAQGDEIPLTLELLSPAKRPIQLTQNLAAFWQGSYKEVQKEMKGRYPKHFWPDDPANAKATNKTKKYM